MRLEVPQASLEALRRTLADDEQQRADRYRFERHRRRFVARRAAQREILAAYTGLPPERLAFAGGRHGKPRLVTPADGPITFSLAHSHDVALLAVAQEGELGVDVERVDPGVDVDSLLRRVATARERDVLENVPPAERRERFFWLWCLKEAYVKAEGVGLDRSLQTLSVEAPWWLAGEVVRVGDLDHPERRWAARPLGGLRGFAAAVASTRPAARVRCRTWGEGRGEGDRA